MARGFGFAKQARDERKARQGSASVFAGKQIFRLPDDGDTAEIWFLEDDDGEVVYGARHHEVPVEGRAWGDKVVCIAQDDEGNITDDPCPGCENDLKISDRYFVLVLWRDAPVYKTDDKGKIVKDNTGDLVVIGNEDQIAVWPMGPKLEEALEEIDESYGLTSTDFLIKRKGTGLETEYVIRPVDVKEPEREMSKAEKKVVSKSDIDLGEFVKPPSYENFKARIDGKFTGGGEDNGGSENGKSSKASRDAAKKNPFNRKKNKKAKRK